MPKSLLSQKARETLQMALQIGPIESQRFEAATADGTVEMAMECIPLNKCLPCSSELWPIKLY